MVLTAVVSLTPTGQGRATFDASSSTTTSERQIPPVVATRPGNAVEYEVGDALNLAYVQRDRLESVDVNLRRRRSRFSSRIGRQRLDVSLNGSQIVGLIGDRSIAMRAARASGQLRIDGMFGMRAIALTVDPQSLVGQVGLCRYELVQRRGAYLAASSAVVIRSPCDSRSPFRWPPGETSSSH